MPNPLVGNFLLGQGGTYNINDVNGPAAYVTGGVSQSVNALGLTSAAWMDSIGLSKSGNYYQRIWAPSGPGQTSFKIQYYVASSNAEVGNGVNLSAEVFRMSAVGVG